MSNGTASQSQFRFQRPADNIYRVGPVGSGMYFTSIQTAVTQAIADGHTSEANPVVIEIYPGTYAESVTIGAGMHLIGVQGGVRSATGVIITGTVTYSPVLGVIADNVSSLDLITINPAAASAKALVFGGTAPARLNVRQCSMTSSLVAGGTTGLLTVSNSGAGSTCRVTDSTLTASLTTDTEIVQLSGSAQVEFFGGQGGINNASGGTIATGVSVAGTVNLNLRLPGFTTGAYTQIFSLTAAGAQINLDKTAVQNTLAGGHIFTATATGTIRARHSGLFTANLAGKIVNAAVAVSVNLHSCDFAGSQALPNAQIDTAVNSFGAGTYNLEQDQVYKEFQVGRGIGYQSIQAAITAAAATGPGNRKVVKIPPGTYVESLTLADNVDLMADTWDDIADPTTLSPVNILGAHTYSTAAGTIRFKGIIFQSSGNASPLFTYTSGGGAGDSMMRFLRCRLVKVFAGTANMFTGTYAGAGSASIVLDECSITYQVTAGAVIDLTGAINTNVSMNGNIASTNLTTPAILIHPTVPGTPTAIPLVSSSPSNSVVIISDLAINAESTELFSMNGAGDYLSIERCKIVQSVIEGTLAKIYAGGFNYYLSESTIDQSVGAIPNGLPCLVRDDGTQASGTITVDTNPGDGDFVTINGVVFTARAVPTQENEFAIGGTTTITAENLRNAINRCLSIGDEGSGGVLALIYATSAINVVTVKAFADAAGNAYTLASSVPLVLILSGATLAGGIDGSGGTIQMGVNSIHGVAGGNPAPPGGGVIALPVAPATYYGANINQPALDAMIVEDEGVQLVSSGQKVTSQVLDFIGAGVTVVADGGNPRKANITIPGTFNNDQEFIAGAAPGDYATIQDALDAADAAIPSGVRRTVLVRPGNYAEDLVLYDNVDLVAMSDSTPSLNGAQCSITGNHSYTPGSVGSTMVIKGFNLGFTSGSFEIVANANSQCSITFVDCVCVKLLDEANPMFLLSNVNGCSFWFQHCSVVHVSDSGSTFDIAAGSQFFWFGDRMAVNNFDIVSQPFTTGTLECLTLGAGASAFIYDARMVYTGSRAFSLAGTVNFLMEYTTIIQNIDEGEMWKFSAAGNLLQTYHNVINQGNSAGDAPLLIRDGDQAQSFVTVDTVPTAGDTLDVNGVTFTAVNGAPAANQFQVDGGATTTDVANNIRDAINASVSAGIDEVVYARASTNVVTITARESGVAGNAIPIESSVPDVMILPGATVTVDTVPTAGDTLTINGVVFTAVNGAAGPDQFQVDGGATTTDVATNIAAAVNTSVSVGVAGVVAASSLANVVSLTVITGIVVGISTSVPLVLLLTGTTFTGGTAGVGGTWITSLNVYLGVSDYMGSVTASLPAVIPTAV